VRRALGALILLAGPAVAATPPPGAVTCSGCHASREAAALASLAGQPAEAIAGKMLAYRRGEGSPTLMDRIARGFSEDEIRAIAAFVAAAR
jgi:cytochrome c553